MSNYLSSNQIWKENAITFKAGDESPVIYRDVPTVKNFLSTGYQDDRFILIGSKGMGKSMLLREKAHLYTNPAGDYNINVHFEVGDNLSEGGIVENITIDKDEKHTEILNITSVNEWSDIWSFAINAIVLLRIGEEWPPEVKNLLNGVTDLSGVISRVIRYSSAIGDYVQHNDILSGLVKRKVKSLAVLYIDCFDNCLSGMLQEIKAKKYKKKDLPPSVKVWTNAQIGAMAAVFSINKATPHLKVGIAVRSEVVPYIEGHNRANLLAVSAELEFDEEELRCMFVRKISLTHPDELIDSEAKNPFARFIGFGEIEHTVVNKNGEQEKEVEDIFQYFLRHTFGRPRELTSIGKAVSQLIQRKKYIAAGMEQRKKLIRRVVNKTANKLMLNYVKEIMPYFPKEQLTDLVHQLTYNVFTVEEGRRLNQDQLKYLYNLGFIGYVNMDLDHPNGELRQSFESPAVNSFLEQQEIPETTHFLMHPCLDRMFIKVKNHRKWYASGNIIGHGRKFIIPEAGKKLLNDWKPLDVSGGRMHKPHDKHLRPLREYYSGLFKNQQVINMHLVDSFGERCDQSFELLLSLYALFYSSNEEKSLHNTKLEEQVLQSGIRREHTAKLYNVDVLALISFFERLVNRSLVLSAYLVLNLPLHVIASLLREGKFRPNEFKPASRRDHNYLQSAFFIRHLSDFPKPDQLTIIKSKLKVWQSLSKVEQYQVQKSVKDINQLLESFSFLNEQDRLSIKAGLDTSWVPSIV